MAHTHWDREWYHPAARFVQRLVALVDDVLAGAPDPARPFLLDGQAVVLEDVLAVHPEWEARLRAHLSIGALEAGPWYVLADELIPSGEALVRNLLAGRRVLARFGAAPPPVCYSPDAFGHPAALPTLARGFGLDVAVVWRGYGGPRWPAGDSARWTAPDGSSVLLWHLPPDGYEYGSALPVEPAAADARWRHLAESAGARATTGVMLLTNGADHHARQPGLDEAIDALAAAAHEPAHAIVHRSSLTQWARTLRAAAERIVLPDVRGELRDSYGCTWTLQGTFGTRAWQKRGVARADAMLRWDVEPWMALARLARVPSPDPALLHAAWRTFLRTLPHDTLCGCSVDAVAAALDHRLASVRAQARGLRHDALDTLLSRDAAVARAITRDAWHPRLVIRNRAAEPRWGVAEVELLTTIGDVAVGPASAQASRPRTTREPLLRAVPAGLHVQPLRTRLAHARRESPHHYPDDDLVHATRALVWVREEEAVPAMGLRLWSMTTDDGAVAEETPPVPVTVRHDGAALLMDNGRLRLTVQDGRVSLHDAAHARTLHDALHVTWQRDAGDAYTPAPRGVVHRLPVVRTRVRARGPLRAVIDVTAVLRIPRDPVPPDLAFDGRSVVSFRNGPDDGEAAERAAIAPAGFGSEPSAESRRGRARLEPIRVRLRLTLDAGASWLGVEVRAFDRTPDHRLRLLLAGGIVAPRVLADAAFGPVERVPLVLPREAADAEHVVRTAPLHRWVTLHDHTHATTIVSDGLAEYEALDDGHVAVTLVRATGELSRGDLPERPGHAGWPARIPRAQGPGRLQARFAVLPGGPVDVAAIEACADAVLRPLTGHTWRDAPADASVTVPGVALSGHGVVASAIKPAEDGDGVILRAVNLLESPGTATWVIPYPDVQVHAVRLDETAEEAGAAGDLEIAPSVTVVGDTTHVRVPMGARAVRSVRVRRVEPDLPR